MKKIGLFYGSDTGCTEAVIEIIKKIVGEKILEIHDAYDIKREDFEKYDHILIGLSTWHDGQLVSSWDDFFEEFKTVNFTDKIIAIFGLGDQYGYGNYFIDGVGILGNVAKENGAKIVGCWSTEGYEFEESKADMGNGFFMGLAIDEDNQDEMTEERVKKWIEQLKQENFFNI